jgi:phosphatidate cytidylyltransferase
VLAALLAVLAALAALEFFRMAETKEVFPSGCWARHWPPPSSCSPPERRRSVPTAWASPCLVVVGLLLCHGVGDLGAGSGGRAAARRLHHPDRRVYTGALLSFGLFLRHLPGNAGALHGTALVLFPVVLTWASDTFAYFAGRRWGTRKLIPRVSPGKTVQGAVGAVVGTVLVAVALHPPARSLPHLPGGILEAVLFGRCSRSPRRWATWWSRCSSATRE